MELPWDRELMLDVLIYHQQTASSGCHCGWARLGYSYCEHVIEVYEESVLFRGENNGN